MTRQDISRLVAAFYANVRVHPRLGPMFERHVGTTDMEWAPHLRKIEAFWADVMLGGRDDRGDPMQANMAVPEIEKSDFDNWPTVFDQTAHKTLPLERAEALSVLAYRIGQSLSMGLQRTRGSKGPPDLS